MIYNLINRARELWCFYGRVPKFKYFQLSLKFFFLAIICNKTEIHLDLLPKLLSSFCFRNLFRRINDNFYGRHEACLKSIVVVHFILKIFLYFPNERFEIINDISNINSLKKFYSAQLSSKLHDNVFLKYVHGFNKYIEKAKTWNFKTIP